MIVFLADLQNSHYRYIRNSVPLGMGYVASYLKKRFGDRVEVRLFRKFEEIAEAVHDETPDLVAFGSYSWNTRLTLKTATFLKHRFPTTIVAVGGPDVSQNVALTAADLVANPQVDFYMPNEGEGPTANLVEALLGTGRPDTVRQTEIAGCLSRNPSTGEAWGRVHARFEDDINEIPSPYLDGTLDSFLDDPDYLPIIQTARGCPYRCTFCVSGKETWSKVKPFDMERIKAEVDYVAERAANRYMRFADENFGIMHRDVEIAEYLMQKRESSDFPYAVSIYTDKHPTDRVKQISSLLRNLMPFNISYQSTTQDVLENIKRINLRDREVLDAISYARSHELTLVSELIFALPGETKASYLASIDKLVEFRFESIAMNQLRILKGSEMDAPADRQRHGVRTKFSMSENGYTSTPEIENVEIDEWVVANNSLSEEEYFEMNRLICLFDFAHFRSYLKELLFWFECHGVSATKLLMRVIERPESYPLLSGMAEKFELGMRSFMKDSPEEVVDYVRAKMAQGEPLVGVYVLEDQLIIDVLKNDRLGEAVDEAARAGMDCYRDAFGAPTDSVRREIALVCDIVYNSFIPAHREAPEELSITSGYDLLAWIANNYDKPLSDYELSEPKPIGLRIRGLDAHQTVWARDEPPDDKYERAFAVINSANRRRALVAPSPRAEAVKSPVYGMTYGFAQDVQRPRPELGTAAG